MHRKRVTSELHDSYFRLMTIKHSISKIQQVIVWALSYYLTQLSLGPKQLSVEFQTVETRYGKEGHTRPRGTSENPRCSCQQTPRGLETRCGRKSHTQPRGPSESPDGVDPNTRRTRHNVTVITVGSK